MKKYTKYPLKDGPEHRTHKITHVACKDSEQPTYTRTLIRIFASSGWHSADLRWAAACQNQPEDQFSYNAHPRPKLEFITHSS